MASDVMRISKVMISKLDTQLEYRRIPKRFENQSLRFNFMQKVHLCGEI